MACENYFFSGCPCHTHPDFATESSRVGATQASLNLSCKLSSFSGSGGSLPHIGTVGDFVYFPFETYSVEFGVFFTVLAVSFAFKNFM